MRAINRYLRTKTAKQVVTFYMFVGMFVINIIACIFRLCAFDCLYAVFMDIPAPTKFVQQIIMAILLLYEIYVLNCVIYDIRRILVFVISIIEVVITAFTNNICDNLIMLFGYIILPIIVHKNYKYGIKGIIVYSAMLLYNIIFLYGRLGYISENLKYNFYINILLCIDYKIFIMVLLLFYKNWGYKLWTKFINKPKRNP